MFNILGNEKVVLKFALHYLEIWDFTCYTNIFSLEVSYVKELVRCLTLLVKEGYKYGI